VALGAMVLDSSKICVPRPHILPAMILIHPGPLYYLSLGAQPAFFKFGKESVFNNHAFLVIYV
jgi:hypothetical protein